MKIKLRRNYNILIAITAAEKKDRVSYNII